ncbi:hypothetical protein QTI33_32035 [Variovorax sp. J22P271]|uniref:hypothetical protein n=1 Tax=Variovorax davisae TaxID=3053515 RepID=UPI0025788AE3|nr:hypothetical protein [Variovorax sp. J22P271]MDM0036803.1 hypothetical protein [Variovorax sp. J22P271]
MTTSTFHFTFESDWRTAPMAYWVHVPDTSGAWVPPAPVAIPHRGFPALRVEAGEHELVFSSPAQVAHCIEVLSTRPLPTSRQLSLKRGTTAGPNGHWLSRLPAALKSPRRREQLVELLRAAYAASVQPDGASFKLPRKLDRQ